MTQPSANQAKCDAAIAAETGETQSERGSLLPEPNGSNSDGRVWKWLLGPSWDTAIGLTIVILVATGLVRGGFYSGHLPYRQQTEAFLQGKLAIGNDVRQVGWDLVWDNGAVQQVWGLGVPAWRTPFEVAGRVCGLMAFPDRLAFGMALVLVIMACLRFHWRGLAEFAPALPASWVAVAAVPLTVSPALLTICRSKFEAYEEAVAYGILASLLLMTWVAKMAGKPSRWGFVGLCLVAGFLPFIRPTFVFYGVSSVLVAGLVIWRTGSGFRVALPAGALCFVVGIGTLLWSNNVRFGRPLEFGHGLNLNSVAAARYASRFDHPFEDQALSSALVELASATFLNRAPPGDSWPGAYAERMFFGQSPRLRWREMYLSTFDLTWLAMLWVAWFWLGRRCWHRCRRGEQLRLSAIEAVCLWSVLPVLALGLFYLRYPFLSSRYLLDFSPALIAAVWTSTALFLRYARESSGRCSWMGYAPALVMGWWLCEAATIKAIGGRHVTGREQVVSRLAKANDLSGDVVLPVSYENALAAKRLKLPFNGSGWNENGDTEAAVAIYIRDPDCLILDVAPLFGGEDEAVYASIQAKIGLEFLERESMTPIDHGMRIIFGPPKRSRYQTGVQVAFIGMTSREELGAGLTGLRLLRVAWHRDEEERE